MNLKEIREKYPQYDILSDDELARALHTKFYPQLEFKDFSRRIGYLKGAQPEEYDPESPEFKAKNDPTAGMSGLDKIRAGWGKAVSDLYRGAQQLGTSIASKPLGIFGPDLGRLTGADERAAKLRQEEEDARRRDEPLLATSGGRAGNIAGNIITALPTAFIPGANTMAGAAAIGAGIGVLQPSTSKAETVQNVATGAALSPAALLGGRVLAAGYRGGKGLVEPFTKGGQERIAARTLNAFAGGRDAAERAANAIARNRQNVLPGVQPTTAELAENAGLAQLERSLRNNPEYVTALTDRQLTNRAAILRTLDEIAGDPVQRQTAIEARSAATAPLYESAKAATVQTDPELAKLLARPSVKKAWDRAKALAEETGDTFETEGEITGKGLHYLKMAMDDIVDNPQANGIGANEARAIRDTRNALLGWIEKNIPQYRQARETYAQMSRPINQMEIGGILRDRMQPALADFGAVTRIRPESFARAMREGDATAARALGRRTASMEDIMEPQQLTRLQQIGQQLARRANADELGRAVGSPTAQNLVSQNVIRQFLGPFGLPESMLQRAAESTFVQSILRPAQFAGKLGEERAMARLAEAALDPQMAERMLREGVPPEVIGLLRYQSALVPVASGANAAKEKAP